MWLDMYLRAICTYEERMDHHCCECKAAKELLRNYLNVALCAQRGTGRDLNTKLVPLIPPYDEYNPLTSLM